jgi:hypothetical protein
MRANALRSFKRLGSRKPITGIAAAAPTPRAAKLPPVHELVYRRLTLPPKGGQVLGQA